MKIDVLKNRVKYLKKYLHKYYKDSKKQYIYALILFTLFIENVSLFSQFYIVRWFGRYRNLLKDTNQQVKYTRLEENIHAQVGIKLINTIREEYPELFDSELEEKVLAEGLATFDAEFKLIDWILGEYTDHNADVDEDGDEELAAINAPVVKEFVKNRINDSLKQIGFKKLFTINRELKKEFKWMEKETLAAMSVDFFHSRPVEYSKKDKAFTVADIFPDKIYVPIW
jgi:ribonucleoside-diphosphate reductase beta chain